MAIQARRGLKEDFDPNKMLPAEVAVPLDTREVYMAFAPGDVQKIATHENVKELIEDSAEEIIEGLTEEVNQATETANGSAQYATTQGDYAKEKGDEAQEIKLLLEEKLANGDFVGEKGEKGDQGDKGDKGDKGADGTGAGDMLKGTYDPQGKEQDIFQYVDDKVDNIEFPIVNDDITGGSDKAASAEIVKTHGVQIQNAQNKADEAFQLASNGKIAIIDAITGLDPSVEIPTDATFQELANAIGQIETGINTDDATATAEQILVGITAYIKGVKVTGAMPNRGAVNQSLAVNGTYTIPSGYHNGSGKVTQSITTKGAATITPSTTDQTIAANQYLTGVQTIKGDANLVPANILSGKSIFGVAGSLTQGKKFATGVTAKSTTSISFTASFSGASGWMGMTSYSQTISTPGITPEMVYLWDSEVGLSRGIAVFNTTTMKANQICFIFPPIIGGENPVYIYFKYSDSLTRYNGGCVLPMNYPALTYNYLVIGS